MPKIHLRTLLSKLTVLALSAAPGVSMAQSVDCDRDLDADASIDRDNVDPHDAAAMLGRSLASALTEVTPLSATHLATSWALSADPLRRAAIASALEWQFPLFADRAIMEHLARDADAQIRIAIARAAWVRRDRGGQAVIGRLVDDADPEVRAVARRAWG